MTTNIIIALAGFIFGVFAGAWGLPKRITQRIGKIKKNGSVEVDMVPQRTARKDRVKFLGIGLWKKKNR